MIDSPQVHLIGKISGARFFDTNQIYLKYYFKVGDNWNILSGVVEGETFLSESKSGIYIPLEHPFDCNFSTKSVRGWPKLLVEVWQVDNHGRNSIAGYGILGLPFEKGDYLLEIGLLSYQKYNYKQKQVCWRPRVGFFERLIGAYPELKHRDILLSSDSRFGLKTQATGKIYIEIGIFTKDFHLHGVQLS